MPGIRQRRQSNGTASSLSPDLQLAITRLLVQKTCIQQLHPHPLESHREGTTFKICLRNGEEVSMAVLAQHTGLDPDQVAYAMCLHLALEAVDGRDEIPSMPEADVRKVLELTRASYHDYREWVDARLAEDLSDFLARHPNIGSVTSIGSHGAWTMRRPDGGWPSI